MPCSSVNRVPLTVTAALSAAEDLRVAGLPALWFVLGGHRAGLALTGLAPAVAVVLFVPLVHSLLVTLGVPLNKDVASLQLRGRYIDRQGSGLRTPDGKFAGHSPSEGYTGNIGSR